MTQTKQGKPADKPKDVPTSPERRTSVCVPYVPPKKQYRVIAKTLLRPEIGAAAVIEAWQANTHDVNDLADELGEQIAAVNRGDLSRAEGLLMAQAQTLNDIFVNLMRRSSGSIPLPKWQAYMATALKTQNQCRMTIATLGELKNPRPVAFVKQANFAQGPQQINNGVARTEAIAGEPNKLLGAIDGERLDIGTSGTTGDADSHLEAVGAIDRTANEAREGSSRTERVVRRRATPVAAAITAHPRTACRASRDPQNLKASEAPQ